MQRAHFQVVDIPSDLATCPRLSGPSVDRDWQNLVQTMAPMFKLNIAEVIETPPITTTPPPPHTHVGAAVWRRKKNKKLKKKKWPIRERGGHGGPSHMIFNFNEGAIVWAQNKHKVQPNIRAFKYTGPIISYKRPTLSTSNHFISL